MAVLQEEKKPAKHPLRSMGEMIVIVAAAIFFALTIQAFAVKPYRIPSPSMMPTLEPGQRILVDRFSHLLGSDPAVGDITVFTPPKGAQSQPGECGIAGQGPSYSGPASRSSCSRGTATKASTTFVKRVVGLPGDTIAIRNGHVIRNGKPAKEPFASSCAGSACNLGTITVPSGSYFLMGDNRGNSDDSRFWGPVPRGWIIGQAVVSYWPPRDIGTL
jgi:signal peptidase I